MATGYGKAGLDELTGRVGQARLMGCSALISLGRLVSLARRACGGDAKIFHAWLAGVAISPESATLLLHVANDFGDCAELDRFDPGAMAMLSTGGRRAIEEAHHIAARGETINFAKAEELLSRWPPPKVQS